MKVQGLIPILNVSSLDESFAWFEKVGWRKLWDWGNPPTFGAIASEKTEIFLCQGCQGSVESRCRATISTRRPAGSG